MTWLDIAFICALCIAATLGFWSGLMWQLYGLFCLFISYFAAVLLHGLIAGPFEEGLGPGTARSLGYTIAFGAVFIGSYSMGLLIKRLLRLGPGLIGRIMGAFLALFQAALICGVVAVGLVDYSSGNLRQTAESSKVVMAFANGAHFLTILIPGNIKEGFKTAKKKVEDVKLEDIKEGLETVKEKTGEAIKSAKEKIEGEREKPQGER